MKKTRFKRRKLVRTDELYLTIYLLHEFYDVTIQWHRKQDTKFSNSIHIDTFKIYEYLPLEKKTIKIQEKNRCLFV